VIITFRFSTIINRLRGEWAALTQQIHHGCAAATTNSPVPRVETITQKPKQYRKPPVPPTLDFDLSEALRLRGEGWSNRHIARKFDCSKDTVRTRLRDYDSAVEAARPKPVPPSVPVVSPVKPPVTVIPTPQIEFTNGTVPPEIAAALVAAAPEPTPVPHSLPNIAPEPVDNLEGLRAYWKVRGRAEYEPPSRFFLVNGADNVQYGTGSEQFVVGVDQWRKEYQRLAIFQHAEKIWVLLDATQDNRAFLASIVSDIWLRERCMVCRITSGGVLVVFQSRMTWHRMYQGRMLPLADEAFEKLHCFIPCPQSNHVQEHEKLLEPAPTPEQMSQTGGEHPLYGGSGYGRLPSVDTYFTPEQKRQITNGDRSGGFAF
jgi:hypothetical protein